MRDRIDKIVKQLTLQEKVSLLSGSDDWHTMPVERLGIPSLIMTDGPHGVRSNFDYKDRKNGTSTAFPTGVSMAASWNPDLIERIGAALGEETRAMNCDILLGPCVNIVRHPLGGRNFESYSEDPYLAGKIGASWVRGVQSRNAGTSLKHYACNNQEIERGRGSSVIDERTLREIYLPAFETIITEADPWTVMCSYNRINGTYASENSHILRDILKGEWEYEGVVISDWGANHTTVESVKGGLDIEMPGPARWYGQFLVEAVKNRQIDEAVIDEAVRRILRMIVRSGKFEATDQVPAGSVDTPEHQSLALKLAEDAITLLKNDNGLLPLTNKSGTIAVIGPNAADLQIIGGGSSFVQPPFKTQPLEEIRNLAGNGPAIRYEQGCDNYVDPPVMPFEYFFKSREGEPGLIAEYFKSDMLGDKPDRTQEEKGINFWWWGQGPLDSNVYSLRLTGFIKVPDSGRYILRVDNSGSAYVYIDDKPVIENKRDAKIREWPVRSRSEYIELTADTYHVLRVEFMKGRDDHVGRIGLRFAFAPEQEKDYRFRNAVELAKKADCAIVFAGMPRDFESEGNDRPHMDLPNRQNALISSVASVNKNTVVVLNCGSPVTMPWIDSVRAVLLAYYPGMMGGKAIANILMGNVSPSGKLPVTFPVRLPDTPAYINFPGSREVFYGERIYVGYRYYDKREIAPLFPFGHGLSYAEFEYGDPDIPLKAIPGETIAVRFTIKNKGSIEAKETAQVYVGDRQCALDRPVRELKGFGKVTLKPGESKQLTVFLDKRAFSFYDPYKKAWVQEPGEFEILIGSSSRDIRLKGTIVIE